eukprot:scaffold35363_cov56-Phaeocystis_antarctica.AAC.1
MKLGVGGVLASSGALPVAPARTTSRAAAGSSEAVCHTGAFEMTARRACTTCPPARRTPVQRPSSPPGSSDTSTSATALRSRSSPPCLVSPRTRASTTAPEPPRG